jgi:hypothetical protein
MDQRSTMPSTLPSLSKRDFFDVYKVAIDDLHRTRSLAQKIDTMYVWNGANAPFHLGRLDARRVNTPERVDIIATRSPLPPVRYNRVWPLVMSHLAQRFPWLPALPRLPLP